MKFIRDIYSEKALTKRPVISFEFSPPRSEDAERSFFEKTIPALSLLKPDFCSCTYGAGGSTRDKTLMISERLQKDFGLLSMAHLTCVEATREQTGAVLEEARARGIQNILALRGDPPGGVGEFTKTEGGFEYSRELVEFIRAKGGFSIGTAGFPEGHIACKAGKLVDWGHLKEKIDAGADFVITQLFFNNADFFEFYNHLVGKLGVKAPIVPGILPIPSKGWITRFIPLCGATIPAEITKRLDELSDDEDAITDFGIEFATRQIEELIKFGVPGVHLYTVNKVRPTRTIMKNLKLA